MDAKKYGLRYGVNKEFPDLTKNSQELLVVPHKGGDLIARRLLFSKDSYPDGWGCSYELCDLETKTYAHSMELHSLKFRVPTITESISILSFNSLAPFKISADRLVEENIQLGYVVLTKEGVFTNPPLLSSEGSYGRALIDEKELKSRLFRAKKVKTKNGNVYLGKNDLGFAKYWVINEGDLSDPIDFVNSGLAKLLEHTSEPAQQIHSLISKSRLHAHISSDSEYLSSDSPGLLGFVTLGLRPDYGRYCGLEVSFDLTFDWEHVKMYGVADEKSIKYTPDKFKL